MHSFLSNHGPLLVSGFIAFLTALAGGIATDTGPWYKGLKQPRGKPPDWAFGPAWTVIFGLIAVAAADLWEVAGDARTLVVVSFLVNAVLNAYWSVLYFAKRRPDHALINIALLWLSIVELVVLGFALDPASGYKLLPYLVWVSYASWLNVDTVLQNGPFGPRADGRG